MQIYLHFHIFLNYYSIALAKSNDDYRTPSPSPPVRDDPPISPTIPRGGSSRGTTRGAPVTNAPRGGGNPPPGANSPRGGSNAPRGGSVRGAPSGGGNAPRGGTGGPPRGGGNAPRGGGHVPSVAPPAAAPVGKLGISSPTGKPALVSSPSKPFNEPAPDPPSQPTRHDANHAPSGKVGTQEISHSISWFITQFLIIF
jgi:hypothetical protein